jgi:hypothetical protein
MASVLPNPVVFPSPQEIDDPATQQWARSLMSSLQTYLGQIALATQNPNVVTVQFQVNYSPPNNPQPGWVAFADGTDWNPGGGRGLYVYSGGVWNLL